MTNMLIISRPEARAFGLKRYFNGAPCKHNHVAKHYVGNGSCCECGAIRQSDSYRPRAGKARCRAIKAAAKEAGLDKYFTGMPCKRGHVAERRTQCGSCVECAYVQQTAWHKDNRSRDRETYGARYKKIRAHLIAYKRNWYKKNARKINANNRVYRLANKDKINALTAQRRAARLQRLPKWADPEAIKFFYECRPKGFVVDHIMPLQGKFISGLHVAENLQWLTPAQNSRKHNHFPYEIY